MTVRRFVFWVDAEHTRKDCGVLTGRVHRSCFGTYLGHEVLVRGRLFTVPHWRWCVAGDCA